MDDYSEFLSGFDEAWRGERGSVALAFQIEGNPLLLRVSRYDALALVEAVSAVYGGAARSVPKREGGAA
jgi:hypothetical protein